jgi:hypothetical protein
MSTGKKSKRRAESIAGVAPCATQRPATHEARPPQSISDAHMLGGTTQAQARKTKRLNRGTLGIAADHAWYPDPSVALGPRANALPTAPVAALPRRRLPLATKVRSVDAKYRPIYAVWEITLRCDLAGPRSYRRKAPGF